jgi:glycerophosphoryl diester phosphodiesterase
MTLVEAISASAPLSILLDVKVRNAAILAPIVAAVTKSGVAERVIFGLRDLALIAELRRHNGDLAILAFLDDPDIATSAATAGAHWFRLWQGEITQDRIAMVRQAGLRLAIMTGQPRNVPIEGEWPPFSVGQIDGAGLAQLLSLRPDAILLDDPHLVSSV